MTTKQECINIACEKQLPGKMKVRRGGKGCAWNTHRENVMGVCLSASFTTTDESWEKIALNVSFATDGMLQKGSSLQVGSHLSLPS